MTEEEGRRLASDREDLIAQGVDPDELTVPLAPPRGITAAGGWCAPSSLHWDWAPINPAEQAKLDARHKQWRHDHRWQLRRNRLKTWLLLRPLRQRIHNHVHRNCGSDW